MDAKEHRISGALLGSALALLSVGLGACEARVSLGQRCLETSECPAGLTCAVGRCRQTCTSATDCGSGRRCLAAEGASVCSTLPDDACLRVEDCGDRAFAACVDNECRTRCDADADCAGGDCVLGGCVERAATDETAVGRVALPSGGGTVVAVGSFLVPDPASDGAPLTLSYDQDFADVAVVVEDTTVGDWSSHVATMQRVRVSADTVLVGVPTRLDVGHRGTRAIQWSATTLESSDATTVAAEPMPDGRAAYLWLIETPDPPTSDDRPGQFAAFARGVEPAMSMSGNDTQRLPGRAFVARGFGATGDGPGWGLRVVDGTTSELQIAGPGAGGPGVARVDIPEDLGRLDLVGSLRAAMVRTRDGLVRFVRLSGIEDLSAASFELPMRSSCAPGLVDRAVVAEGNYVAATCDGARVTLSRITCPAAESRALEPCEVSAWLTLDEPAAPASVALESWPGGVVVVTRDADGAHVRPVSEDATSDQPGLRYEAVLPASYRVDALTDFHLVHTSSNAAARSEGAIAVVAGLYVDDNDVAQIRLGIVEVGRAP